MTYSLAQRELDMMTPKALPDWQLDKLTREHFDTCFVFLVFFYLGKGSLPGSQF
jgi:hypothetical protein